MSKTIPVTRYTSDDCIDRSYYFKVYKTFKVSDFKETKI